MYDDEDYEEKPTPDVGYGRPPKAHQFQKGRSGNPKGRPKKCSARTPSSSLPVPTAEMILQEANRLVQVREGDTVSELTSVQALIRSLTVNGLKGNRRSAEGALKLMRTAEQELENEWAADVQTVNEGKQRIYEVFAQYDAQGRPRPDILPHPDEVVLDFENRMIVFNGPKDEAERARWNDLKRYRDGIFEDMEAEKEFCRKEGCKRAKFEYGIAFSEAQIKFYDSTFPDEKTRRAPGFHIHKWRAQNGVLALVRSGGLRALLPERHRGYHDELKTREPSWRRKTGSS